MLKFIAKKHSLMHLQAISFTLLKCDGNRGCKSSSHAKKYSG